jgi:hypothetical protein
MDEEIAALERTGTWDLVSPPPGIRPITCKWVYKIKTRSDGSLERYKARLVARGFQQEPGRDYDETFAPMAHMTTMRTLLIVASVRHWSVVTAQKNPLFRFVLLFLCIIMHISPCMVYKTKLFLLSLF